MDKVLGLNDFDVLLAPYGIFDIKYFSILSGGQENSNYHIVTSSQEYVLTISENKSLEQCQHLASLLDYLADEGFRSSKVIKRLDGNVVSLSNDKIIMLKTYIRGNIVADLSADILCSLGEQLASLHMLEAPKYLPTTISFGKEQFANVAIYAAQSAFHDWLIDIHHYIHLYISDELPKTLIHSDVFYNNIIVSNDNQQATIMDFEEASFYYRVFDIGMIVIGTCCYNGKLDAKKAKSLLKGYQNKARLNEQEVNALQAFTVYAGAATAYWRHQNYNYVNKDENMAMHYLPLQELVNTIKKIPADEFLTIL